MALLVKEIDTQGDCDRACRRWFGRGGFAAVVSDLWTVVRFGGRTGIIEGGVWPEMGGCGGLALLGWLLRS